MSISQMDGNQLSIALEILRLICLRITLLNTANRFLKFKTLIPHWSLSI